MEESRDRLISHTVYQDKVKIGTYLKKKAPAVWDSGKGLSNKTGLGQTLQGSQETEMRRDIIRGMRNSQARGTELRGGLSCMRNS